ncbi:MAG: RNase adapter RapZ, partial [Acetomicrobium sp.]
MLWRCSQADMFVIEGDNYERQAEISCGVDYLDHKNRRISKCIIITGMSGGGKSTALKVLEDIGFYTIDNIPPAILPQIIDMLGTHEAAVNMGVAVVIDVRGGTLLGDFEDVIKALKSELSLVKVIFLDASDEILIRRYETTRRRHPLGVSLPLSEMILK